MADLRLEQKIEQAFNHVAPDSLETILSRSKEEKGQVIHMNSLKRKSNLSQVVLGIAASILFFAAGIFAVGSYNANNRIANVVSLDVNPSISIDLNRKEKVLSVKPLNDDGVIIIDGMDFSGSSLDVTINALIGSMLRHGYLSDIANSILVSVDGSDIGKSEELKNRIATEIEQLLGDNAFSGSVLSQTVSVDETLRAKADSHNISVGKAQLVEDIAAGNIRYDFEDIYDLSINELNLIKDASADAITAVQSVGSASDLSYIGETAAKAIALERAGVKEKDISRYHCEYDWEQGAMIYEIEFIYNGLEYETEINATTGDIIKHSCENDNDYIQVGSSDASTSEHKDNMKHGQDTQSQQPQTEQPTQQTSANQPVEDIGRDKAISIALDHAGVAATDARDIEAELDYERSVLIYEIEFKSNGMEYSYEINAVDGTIIKSEKEWDD